MYEDKPKNSVFITTKIPEKEQLTPKSIICQRKPAVG
jgi:hypothetical protein